jgi:protein TonB
LNILPGNGRDIAGYYSGIDRVVGELLPVKGAVIPPLEKPQEKKIPVRIGRLEPSRLIFRVNPAYPELAKKSGVSGEVDLEALIDEEGNVTEVKIVKGHPLLCGAAAEALKKWKYTPTVHNGEPVPVLVSVKIVFRIR